MVSTRIIDLMVTNHILDFDLELKDETKNFVETDYAETSKNGTMQDLVDRYFDI